MKILKKNWIRKICKSYFFFDRLSNKTEYKVKMSNLNNMEPLASWGENNHTQVPEDFCEYPIADYVCYNVPRKMFRQAASLFSDVRHTDASANFDEITLQTFLQMIAMSANLDKSELPKEGRYPFIQAWLEWVPHRDNADRAVAYRIHAISSSKDITFGKYLSKMLSDTAILHKDSMSRKMNSRKVDPLSGLHPYQKWMKVSGLEMYTRTICDRYAENQEFTEQMDDILDPMNELFGEDDTGLYKNPVKPKQCLYN